VDGGVGAHGERSTQCLGRLGGANGDNTNGGDGVGGGLEAFTEADGFFDGWWEGGMLVSRGKEGRAGDIPISSKGFYRA
jgi:hypothetical protein